MSGTTSLEGLVKILAQPHVESRRIKDHDGTVEVKYHQYPPLLTLLEAAVAEGMERGGGRGSGYASKVPLASDAHALADEIRGYLIRGLIDLGAPIVVSRLADLMLAWHAALKGDVMAWSEAEHLETLASWDTAIRRIIEPPSRMRVLECPLCGATRWRDGDTETDMAWIEYDRSRAVESMQLMCHACGVVATGLHAVAASTGTSVRHGMEALAADTGT